MPHRPETGPSTRCLHGGRDRKAGLALPVFPSAVYDFENLEDAIATFEKRREGFIYSRFAHPTGEEVERRLAAVQGTDAAVLCSSGMAAIALTLLTFCRSGDHLLASRELYGGTTDLLKDYAPALGLEVEFVSLDELQDLSPRVRENTTLVLVESPTNPLVHVVDFEALFGGLSGVANRPVMVLDSTLATPLGHDPVAAGFDVIIHSATKYLGGHDDLLAGVVLGSTDLMQEIEARRRIFGTNCDPQTAWLLERGLKTLSVRWERQCGSAGVLARKLEAHPRVERVHYPGLPSHPHHDLARKQMRSFGALLAFEVTGGLDGARATFDALNLIARAPSLGGVDSMVLHPPTASHRSMPVSEREEIGITDGMLRLSVGIEDPEDIWADLEQAL